MWTANAVTSANSHPDATVKPICQLPVHSAIHLAEAILPAQALERNQVRSERLPRSGNYQPGYSVGPHLGQDRPEQPVGAFFKPKEAARDARRPILDEKTGKRPKWPTKLDEFGHDRHRGLLPRRVHHRGCAQALARAVLVGRVGQRKEVAESFGRERVARGYSGMRRD